MTDKRIIIDGVDVSKCKYLPYYEDKQGNCGNNLNCYYKQLKRAENQIVDLNKMVEAKEQECEELNKTITNLENIRDKFSTKLDQLKEKNEKMSRGYAELTEIIIPYIDDFSGYNEKLDGFDIVLCIKELVQQFQEESKELYYRLGCSAAREQKWKRYKQALKEVQQIILNIRNDKDFVGENKLWQMVFDIEKIISECEAEDEQNR